MEEAGMNLKGSEHKWVSKPCQRTEKLLETQSFTSHDEILEDLSQGNSSKEKQELHSEKELKMGSSVPKEAQARTPGVPFLGKNVSLSTFLQSALKTSISEVLRKNIDASDREKESRSLEKSQLSERNNAKSLGRGETLLSASSTPKIKPDILYTVPHIVKSRQSRVRPKIGMNAEEIEIIPEHKIKSEPSFQEGDHDSYVTSSPPRACALKSFPSHATKTFLSHATKTFPSHATKSFSSHATKTFPSHATKTFHSHATKTFPSHATKSLTSLKGSKQMNNIVIVKTEPGVSQPESPVTADLTPIRLNERCQVPDVIPHIHNTTLAEVDKGDEALEAGTVQPVQMKPIKSEENMNLNSLTNVSSRSRKIKKRHFKGATYGLYLTPKRKRKSSKKASDSNSRDDEISLASTENGSCIDSDGSSLFSDFTPSEKSLADDEVCSSSRCSPILLPSEHQIELSTFKESPLSSETRNYSQPNNAHVENNDKQSVNFSKLSDSLHDNEDAASLVHMQLIRCATSKKGQSENHDLKQDSAENHSEKEKKMSVRKSAHDSTKSAPVFSPDKCRSTNTFDPEDSLLSNSNVDADSGHGNSGTAAGFSHHSSKIPNTLDSNDTLLLSNSTGDSASKTMIVIKTEPGLDESPVTVPSSFAFLSDDMQEYYNANENRGESSANANSSTIARSVKSRQRTRRRFTDDIVDTEIGLLSLNSLPCKKIKVENQPQKTVYIADVIGSLSEFTENLSRTPKTGPIIKAEFIYNPKLPPIGKCMCVEESVKIKFGKDRVNVFCQAVDSFDDKRVGCCNPVRYCHLVRPSTRIPFTVMCDMHLWRLKIHHCCPHCGLFCSQGVFLCCSGFTGKDRHKHLFHKNCLPLNDRNDPYCLHCGNGLKIRMIHLSVSLPASPARFLYGDLCKLNPSAKMSAPSSRENARNYFKVVCPSKSKVVFSANGLFVLNDMTKFETMLKKLASMRKEDIPDYPANDLYIAAREGCTSKIMYMLYRGVSPSRKFLEYNRETALHAVATTKNVIIAHLLLQAGALIDEINDSLQTPLMIATENNQVEMASYLIHRRATTDTRGESGMTCLHLAAKEGNLEMCGALLANPQIKLDVQDDGGWTPIVWASEHGHAGIVRLLLQKGADPNIRDKEGNTALHWAAFSGNSRICDACVAHGCIVNEVNVHGDTPLHIAARQDNGSCVEFLLNNGAAVDCRNKAQQLPIDCCGKETASSKNIRLHSMMVQLFKKDPERVTRIVTTDMALGREKIPIACVNWIDDVDLVAKDFLYVTENCQTGPVKMDRSIGTLQSCECHGDCVSLSCTCSNISFKCWYDRDGRLVPEFNMIDPPMLFECNRACLCDIVNCRNRVVQKGISCRLQLVRTNGKGWGVRTLKDIPKGTFICEYVGEIITDSEADKRQDDSYLFDLDNRDGETYCLDARRYGNISRFINHLCEPNLVPIKVFVNHQDLSFPRIAFFSARDIKAYEELGFDYGEKFWVIKSKWFTCSCGSPGCKYSAETIHETLSHYSQRNDEQVEGNSD